MVASVEHLSHFRFLGSGIFNACANLIWHTAVRDATYHGIISYPKSNQFGFTDSRRAIRHGDLALSKGDCCRSLLPGKPCPGEANPAKLALPLRKATDRVGVPDFKSAHEGVYRGGDGVVNSAPGRLGFETQQMEQVEFAAH